MALATGARTQLRYILESVFGTTPVAGNPNNLRRVDDSLGFKTQSAMSQEVRSDRQTPDTVLVGASAEGGINFEMSYKEYDTLLAAALQGTWAVYGTNGVGTTFVGTFTTSKITAGTAPTGGSAFTTLSKGQWIKLSAPTHANDGKIVQVSKTVSPTATEITLEGTPLTTGTSISGCFISTSRLTNGTTQSSFSLEREHSDISKFLNFRGMTCSKLSLNLQSGAIVTGSFEFIGKDQVVAGATAMPGTPIGSATYDVMNAVTGVGDVQEGGAAITGTFIKTLSLALDNKLRGRDGIGVLGNVDIGSGSLEITGQMTVYFANTTLYEKFLNSTRTSLSFRMADPSGNGYVITLPSIKFSEANIEAGNKDSDSMVNMTYTALMDPTLLKTIFIDRVGVAVA